jgi:hypothetical protein
VERRREELMRRSAGGECDVELYLRFRVKVSAAVLLDVEVGERRARKESIILIVSSDDNERRCMEMTNCLLL